MTETPMESRVRDITERIAQGLGLEMVLVEYIRGGGRMTVRLTIDREGGVTLDDCAAFSRHVGAEIEADDPIPVAYSLEVSSPGLDRRLVREADFEQPRSAGAQQLDQCRLPDAPDRTVVYRHIDAGCAH